MSEQLLLGWTIVDNITSASAGPLSAGSKIFVPIQDVDNLKEWWAHLWSTDYRAFVTRIDRVGGVDVDVAEVWTYKKFSSLFILLRKDPGGVPQPIPAGWTPFLGGGVHNWFEVATGSTVPALPSTANWSDGGPDFAFVRKVVKCIIVLWLTDAGRVLLWYFKDNIKQARRFITIRPDWLGAFVSVLDDDQNRAFEDRFHDGARCPKFREVPLLSSPRFPEIHKIYLSPMLGDTDQCIVTGAPFPVWLVLAHEILHALKDDIAPDAVDAAGLPKFGIITGGPVPSLAVLRDFSQVGDGQIPPERKKKAFYEMLAVYGRKSPQYGYAGVGPSENELRNAYGLARREKYHGPSGPAMAQKFIVPGKYLAGTGLTQPDAGLTGGGLQELGLPVFAKK